MNEEKEVIDEFVKTLKFFRDYNPADKNFYQVGIDLIHRLQDENERLTKEKSFATHKMMESKAKAVELQKQVDELTDKLGKVLSTVGIDEYKQSKAIEQAVKDTAKEILKTIKLNGTFGYGGYVIYDSTIERIAERYGVEVE